MVPLIGNVLSPEFHRIVVFKSQSILKLHKLRCNLRQNKVPKDKIPYVKHEISIIRTALIMGKTIKNVKRVMLRHKNSIMPFNPKKSYMATGMKLLHYRQKKAKHIAAMKHKAHQRLKTLKMEKELVDHYGSVGKYNIHNKPENDDYNKNSDNDFPQLPF